MTSSNHDLPCCRCGLPVPLDGSVEPPGTIAMHAVCAGANHQRWLARLAAARARALPFRVGPAGARALSLLRRLAAGGEEPSALEMARLLGACETTMCTRLRRLADLGLANARLGPTRRLLWSPAAPGGAKGGAPS